MSPRWDDIRAFIWRRSPERARDFVGASDEEVAQLEARCAVALPALYRGFLATMGRDHGDFFPLGEHYACDLDTLLAALPDAKYPRDRYFKVGYEAEPEAVACYDMFLDLRRGDGADAPLVSFEDDEWFHPEAVREVGFTLADRLTSSTFDQFELQERKESKGVMVRCDSAEDMASTVRRIHTQMRAIGLAEALPGTPRIACLGDAALSVMTKVYAETSIVYVNIGAPATRAVNRVVEGLLGQFPSASVDR